MPSIRSTKRAASAAMLALAIAFAAAGPNVARADDEECDAVVKSLGAIAEEVMKGEPKTQPALCAGMGQLVALMRATREVAEHCMSEGEKREAIKKDMSESAKAMAGEIEKSCK